MVSHPVGAAAYSLATANTAANNCWLAASSVGPRGLAASNVPCLRDPKLLYHSSAKVRRFRLSSDSCHSQGNTLPKLGCVTGTLTQSQPASLQVGHTGSQGSAISRVVGLWVQPTVAVETTRRNIWASDSNLFSRPARPGFKGSLVSNDLLNNRAGRRAYAREAQASSSVRSRSVLEHLAQQISGFLRVKLRLSGWVELPNLAVP